MIVLIRSANERTAVAHSRKNSIDLPAKLRVVVNRSTIGYGISSAHLVRKIKRMEWDLIWRTNHLPVNGTSWTFLNRWRYFEHSHELFSSSFTVQCTFFAIARAEATAYAILLLCPYNSPVATSYINKSNEKICSAIYF